MATTKSKKAASKTKIELTESEKSTVLRGFYCTWEYIAQDASELGPLSNRDAVTMCFDYIDRDANDAGETARIVLKLLKEHDFKKVRDYLVKHLNLV